MIAKSISPFQCTITCAVSTIVTLIAKGRNWHELDDSIKLGYPRVGGTTTYQMYFCTNEMM